MASSTTEATATAPAVAEQDPIKETINISSLDKSKLNESDGSIFNTNGKSKGNSNNKKKTRNSFTNLGISSKSSFPPRATATSRSVSSFNSSNSKRSTLSASAIMSKVNPFSSCTKPQTLGSDDDDNTTTINNNNNQYDVDVDDVGGTQSFARKLDEEEEENMKIRKEMDKKQEELVQSITLMVSDTKEFLEAKLQFIHRYQEHELKSSMEKDKVNMVAGLSLALVLIIDLAIHVASYYGYGLVTERYPIGLVRFMILLGLIIYVNVNAYKQSSKGEESNNLMEEYKKLKELMQKMLSNADKLQKQKEAANAAATLAIKENGNTANGHDIVQTTEKNEPPQDIFAIVRSQVSTLGNGSQEELSDEQVEMIKTLRDDMIKDIISKQESEEEIKHLSDWCEYEACRRFLVARGWNYKKAYEQLYKCVQWRIQTKPDAVAFENNSKCYNNPFALSMRLVGFDKDGRPMIFTSFSQANDRFEVEGNMVHFGTLLESTYSVLMKRSKVGLNKPANTKQWSWIIDFDGFGLRDQNPSSAMYVARLMSNYPEMLHMAILVDAPFLFSATWKMIQPVLDDRIKAKVSFVNISNVSEKLETRIGSEATEWIKAEIADNRLKRPKDSPKKYWIAPTDPNTHNPRGLPSYVISEWYVRTPGDRWEDAKRAEENTPSN